MTHRLWIILSCLMKVFDLDHVEWFCCCAVLVLGRPNTRLRKTWILLQKRWLVESLFSNWNVSLLPVHFWFTSGFAEVDPGIFQDANNSRLSLIFILVSNNDCTCNWSFILNRLRSEMCNLNWCHCSFWLHYTWIHDYIHWQSSNTSAGYGLRKCKYVTTIT